MPEKNFLYHIRYYAIYQLIFVAFTVILSSAGAFFHFLLEHEISIVEAWLHNNHWEILLISKIGSLYLINRWFQIRLYQVKSIKELVMKLLSWPDAEAPVISIFMLVSYIALAKVSFVGQNMGYWYYHLVGFIGIFLFFGLEFVVIAQLDDVLGSVKDELNGWKSVCYLLIFAAAYRMSVPDYYELLPYMLFCFSTLLYLSGKSLKNWSNVVCFLLLFVAPMGAVFGLDPAWGNDFSPLKIDRKVSMSLLAAIWLVSFGYYKYRNQLFHSVRKLLR